MLSIDKWQEIYATVRKNKLRTFLTAFGVFWGIFMLVLLLGAGKGFENGVHKEFGGALNSIYIWSGKTSVPHGGSKPGKTINFTDEDLHTFQNTFEETNLLSPRNRLQGEFVLKYKDKNGAFQVLGISPAHFSIDGQSSLSGRLLNDKDLDEKRKTVIIGTRVQEVLFGEDEDPIGKYIDIKGVYFKVVGVFKDKRNDSRRQSERVYIPHTTYQQAFNSDKKTVMFMVTPKAGIPAKQLEEKIKSYLAKKYNFSADDPQALGISNSEENYKRIQGLFTGINVLIWVVGIGTLLAGIVGVSNIMLIIVKERTREIGVRKAIGATPFSIVSLILQESVIITAIAGYAGLTAGVGILELLRMALNKAGDNASFFSNPEIDLGVAVTAIGILVVSGALAGLIPAVKAAKIKPIEALRA